MDNSANQEIMSDGLERVSQAARFLGVSRSFVYKLIHSGDQPSVQIGRSRRIPIRAVRDLAVNNMVVYRPTLPD